ncbi:MAG: RDD family protein [Desulfobacteraceae bacterium]|nr:RDD family protein [Desulfobacteraceae bacterium]
MGQKTNALTITTPEGVIFPLLLAGPVTRFLAWVIDWICIVAIVSFATKFINIFQIISQDFSQGVYMLFYFFISFSYAILTEWFWNGQTLGKRLLKLRVMDVQGLQLKLGQVVIRNLLRAVDGFPFLYMVGGIATLVSKNGQRIGDIAANTIVIISPRINQPELNQILSDKFNSFKQFPRLCARLRQKISPNLADIALQALLRRNRFTPESRINVFQNIAGHFKEIVPFPQQATEGISDEQYIRNAVEILFNSDGNSPV